MTDRARGSAPGRVNLLGEHTDYNGGLALPLAIPQRTSVDLRRRTDHRVEVRSASVDPPTASYELGQEHPSGEWVDYVMGVTRILAESHAIPGFDAVVTSDVPVGSGLSSSAALEIALLRGLRELAGLPLDDLALARLGRRAEVEFVGVPVGLLDQLAVTWADPTHALRIDFLTGDTERVAVPDSLSVAVIDSGQRRALASGDYALRRAECDRAAALLGVTFLAELDESALARIAALPSPLDRRARHVVTEDDRVRVGAEALRAGDSAAFGRLVDESHASLRDDFECSTPEIDDLVAVARGCTGALGARVTGGGWGGAIVVVTDPGHAGTVAAEVAQRGAAIRGLSPKVLVGGTANPPT